MFLGIDTMTHDFIYNLLKIDIIKVMEDMDKLPESAMTRECGCEIIVNKFTISLQECVKHKRMWMFARI